MDNIDDTNDTGANDDASGLRHAVSLGRERSGVGSETWT